MKKQLNNLAWTKCLLAVMALLLVPKGAWGQTTYYDLWVAGTQVTSDNAGDVFDGDETNDDKVTYNADSKTLTLNGATIRTGNDGIVSNIEELTINLVGENILECSTNTSVVFKTTLEEPTPKIKFTSTSTTAQLQVAFNKDYGALYDGVNLDYNNIFEYVESGVDYDYIQPISYGITISTTDIAEKNVDILNASNVLGDNGTTVSFDSSTNTLTLNGAAISTISYSNESPLIIALSGTNSLEDMIYCEEMTEQPSLTFTKAGSESCSLTMGECSDGIIAGFSSVTCGEGIYLHTITPSKCAGKFFVSAIDGESITSATVSSVVSYPLWVSGTQVTASNASSLLDGKASFADNTLTLNGATLTSNIISNLTSLTIVLNGSNTIELQEGATNSCITTTNSGSTLTFTKGNDTAGLGLNGTNNSGNSIVGGFTSVSFDCLKILGVDAYNYKYAITYDTSDKKYENSDGSAVTKGSIFNFLSGEGTAASPYLITTAAELQSFAGWVNDGTIKDEYIRLEVENNLDCSSLTGFTPIGSSDYYFKGTFDGNSKTISNLEITEIGNVVGLFGNVGSDDFAATIKNLTLSGCTFSGADENGAIAGQLSNGTIQGCTVTDCTITSGAKQSSSAGGIAGFMYEGTITGCTVKSSSSTPTTIKAYSVYSDGGGIASAGGVVGWVHKTGDVNISNNSVAGTVNIVGNHTNGKDDSPYAGCIIGKLAGTIGTITLENNTYEQTATTSRQGAEALSGSTARGIGYNGTNTSYDVLANNGAVLDGLKKITISSATLNNGVLSITGGTITYTPNDRFDSTNKYIYCLPGETATLTFTPTPNAGYLQPTISGVEGATTTYYNSSNEVVTDASDAAYTTYSFTMPESDVTISAVFPYDIASESVAVSVNSPSYTGSAITPAVTVSIPGETTILLSKDEHYTLSYKQIVSETETVVESMTDAGSYKIVVTGIGSYGGSREVAFVISQATNSITTTPVAATTLTYSGEAQNLLTTAAAASFGDVEYKVGTDGTYSTDAPQATAAGTYTVYYKVTETTNYAECAEASIEVTIAKATPTLSFSPESATYTYGSDFTEPTLTNEKNLTVTYSCASATAAAVATVNSETGEVTAVAVGTATITATFAGNDNYNEASASYALTIQAGQSAVENVPTAKENLVYTGAAQDLVTAGTATNGTMQYSLTADGTFTATVPQATTAGTYTVYYKVAGNANYNDVAVVETPISVTIAKAAAGLGFSSATATATYGAAFTAPTLTNPNELTVTYSSSATGVATVDASTGTVTLVGAGETTITASFAGNDNYEAGNVSYTLTVSTAAAGLEFSSTTATATYGTAFTAPTLTNPNKLTVTYSSSEASVATVDTSTGTVTLVGAGETTITATSAATSQYSAGSATYTLTVEAGQSAVENVPTAKENLVYNGAAQDLVTAGTATNGTMQYSLTADGTFTATVPQATAAGNYTVYYKVAGNANYNDVAVTKVPIDVTISKAALSGVTIADIASQTFTGTAIEPAVTVTFNGNAVAADQYTVSYTNNTNVGTAQVTLTAAESGNFSGTATKNFTITAKDLSGATIADIASQTYTGEEITPTLTVTLDGKTLTAGTDYTVAYTNNTDAGTATATITGTGNYTGTASKTFTIGTATISATAADVVVTYDGDAYGIEVSVTTPEEGYTIMYGTTAGTYTAEVSPTLTDVGTTTVYYKVSADNYTDFTGSAKITIKASTADLTVTLVDATATITYDGTAKEPAVTVMSGNTTLTAETDYTVAYADNTNAGEATITVTGNGNYAGASGNKAFTISKAALSGVTIADIASQTYTGTAIKPAVTVTFNGNAVAEDQYTVLYTNNTNVGTEALVTLTAAESGNFSGTATKNFTITAKDLSGATIADIASQTYTGEEITPTLTVTFDGKSLTAGTDYTVAYTNNTNAGTATATITGKGNYTGTASKTFTIAAATISASAEDVIVTYDGDAYGIEVSVTTPEEGYTIMYGTTAGTYDAEVSPTLTDVGTTTVYYKVSADNYTDFTGSAKVTINPTNADLTVALTDATVAYTYDGTAKEPAVTVTCEEIPLTAGTDYTVAYADNINAGEATITVTGKGNYSGTGSKKFNIAQASIAGATFATVADQTYTGSAITPTPELTLNSTTLVAGTDYTLSYTNNTELSVNGAATITATGKGNYTGTVQTTFNIVEDLASEIASVFGESQTYGHFLPRQNLNLPAGVKAYVVTGINLTQRTVTIAAIDYLPQGIPVLLERTGDIGTTSLYTGTTAEVTNLIQTAGEGGVAVSASSNISYYVLFNGEYVKVTSGTTIPAGRFYLQATGAQNAPRRLSIDDSGNGTTGINEVRTLQFAPEDRVFDMQGRQVDQPVKGRLYIVNGKKVVFKK